MASTLQALSVTSFNMRTLKFFLEAVLIIIGMMTLMTVILGNKPIAPQVTAYQPWQPVIVSPEDTTTREWDDNLDSTYTDSWGITYKTRK